MHCLYDYIGIKGYGSQEPLSGIFINQLPGITLEGMDKIAEKEQLNLAGVWKDVQARSWVRLEKDFRMALRNRFRLSAIKAFAQANPVVNPEVTIAQADKYRGLVVDINNVLYESFFQDPSHDNEYVFGATFNRSKGSFLSIYIDRIGLTLKNNADTLTIKVFDERGVELFSVSKANATAGYNEFIVMKKFFTQRVFVAVDASALELYEATLPQSVLDNCYQSLLVYCESCNPVLFGAEAEKATPGTLTKTTSVFLNVSYSAVCDYSSIICQNRPEFTDVWLNLLGTELMLERSYSSRMNRYNTIDKEQAVELKDFYSVQYEKALKETVDALEISEEDCCIECNPQITHRESLP